MVGSKHVTDKEVEDIQVIIPFSQSIGSTTLTSKIGQVNFDDTTKVIIRPF